MKVSQSFSMAMVIVCRKSREKSEINSFLLHPIHLITILRYLTCMQATCLNLSSLFTLRRRKKAYCIDFCSATTSAMCALSVRVWRIHLTLNIIFTSTHCSTTSCVIHGVYFAARLSVDGVWWVFFLWKSPLDHLQHCHGAKESGKKKSNNFT